MANDWLATAWAKIFRTDLAAEIRKRNDQPQPKTPDTDSEETLKPGSSTESDDAAVTDDSETDNPQAPDTASHDDNHSDNDNPSDATANASKETHDQNKGPMGNQSSDFTGSAAGFIGVFRKLFNDVVTKVRHAVLDASNSIRDAVKKLKELGMSGVAKNIRNWVQENPWKTALIVVPLVALACTAIALLAVGFGL